MRFAILIDK